MKKQGAKKHPPGRARACTLTMRKREHQLFARLTLWTIVNDIPTVYNHFITPSRHTADKPQYTTITHF